jgi:hypothetical protein
MGRGWFILGVFDQQYTEHMSKKKYYPRNTTTFDISDCSRYCKHCKLPIRVGSPYFYYYEEGQPTGCSCIRCCETKDKLKPAFLSYIEKHPFAALSRRIITFEIKDNNGKLILAIKRKARTLEGYDFSGQSLVNANFSNMKLKRASFFDCNLVSANFYNSDLRRCRFENANLCNATISHCMLRAAHLQSSILHNVSFVGSELMSAHFDNADITGADFTGANIKLSQLANTICD